LPLSFKDYVLTGRFNKVASEAVADAIARTKAAGLLVVDGASTSDNRPVQTGSTNESSDRLSRRQDAKSTGSNGSKTTR